MQGFFIEISVMPRCRVHFTDFCDVLMLVMNQLMSTGHFILKYTVKGSDLG